MSQSEDFDALTQFRAQFNWSSDFSPKALADNHRKLFPAIAVVSSGYDGCDGMHEFALDEVYCIVDIKRQKRVVVTDLDHRFISIPLDYHVKFHTVGDTGKIKDPVRTLSQIFGADGGAKVENIRLMFEDNQAVKFNECASTGSRDKMGCLEYDETYDEKYLVCHPLQSNEILADVVLIPVYVPISLTLALGFSPLINGEFGDWMAAIKSSVKAFDSSKIKPCMDIVVFDESPASDYVTIMPVSLFQHNKNEPEVSPGASETREYGNITCCRERKKSRDARDEHVTPLKGRQSVFIGIPEQSALPPFAPKLPPRSPHPGSPKERRSPKTAKRSTDVTSPMAATPPPLPPRTESVVKSDQKTAASGHPKLPLDERSKVVLSSVPKDPRSLSNVSNDRPPPPPPLGLRAGKATKPFPTGNATRFVKDVEESAESHQPTSNAKTPSSPSKSSKDVPNVPAAEKLATKQLHHGNLPRKPPVTRETQDEANLKSPAVLETKPNPSEGISGVERSWKRAAEIPADLDMRSLSVEELCHCLDLLKMPKYSKLFRDQMVDGMLLMELPDESLSEQFGFSIFEIKKLSNFARNGWRPKTD